MIKVTYKQHFFFLILMADFEIESYFLKAKVELLNLITLYIKK